MRIALVVGLIVAAAPAVAHAGKGKPSAAEAKKAAQAWMAAMTSDDPESTAAQAKALTATPFFSFGVIDGPGDPPCPESMATDAAAIDKRLECLRGAISSDGSYLAWSAKLAKQDGFAQAYKKQLAAMAKVGTLVALDEECQGVFNLVIFETVKDDTGAVKIATVLSTHGECGE